MYREIPRSSLIHVSRQKLTTRPSGDSRIAIGGRQWLLEVEAEAARFCPTAKHLSSKRGDQWNRDHVMEILGADRCTTPSRVFGKITHDRFVVRAEVQFLNWIKYPDPVGQTVYDFSSAAKTGSLQRKGGTDDIFGDDERTV